MALSAPRIVCAALRSKDGWGVVAVGPRHFDQTMRRQLAEGAGRNTEQGFIDQHGVFYTREQAWLIAQGNGQIIRRVGGDEGRLFSENLY
jgi:hypothetical protein